MKNLFTLILALSFLSCFGQKKENFTIETTDITNFWIAFDSIKTIVNKVKVFKDLYHDKASNLFKEQIQISGDMQNIDNYLKSFEKYPKFWESIREPTLDMRNISDKVQLSFDKVKQVYPDFKAGDVCIFISPLLL